nr:retrotransposon-related protein [Tanacetum cinerariifolium]
MTNVQQGSENPEILEVIEDAHVTLSTVPQKTEVSVTSSSHLFDLTTKFLNFSDIPHTDAEIVSPLDVHVHHKVPSKQTSIMRVTTLEKEVAELKRDDPLKTHVSALVDEHLDARLGATRDEFMNFLLVSITARITKQVKNQIPHILPKEVSNFSPPVIQSMVTESLKQAVLAKESSKTQSSYEAAATFTKFELKKILIKKMDKSESYLAAPEHRDCYEGLKKSYDLDKTFFSIYGKVYLLKRRRKDKDKDEDPFVGSDRGLKKRKTSKNAESTKSLKAKESQSSSSKGNKSKSKSFGKAVHSEERGCRL